jgi:outer membrane protein G
MKKILTIVLLGASFMINAQTFEGKGDIKLNIGMTLQNGGTGILVSGDYGLGKNFSVGVLSSYLLGVNDFLGKKPALEDRFDAKLRFNANLGNVINVDPKLDIYPGLNLGLKNFGGHIGARYFFSDGFGVFSEFSVPFAKYDANAVSKYNNGASFNIGASFNLD